MHDAEGAVERVDLARGVLSLRTAAGTLELQVSDSTTFLLDGRRAGFAELRRGERVRVTYEPSLDRGLVHWVETTASGGAVAPVLGS